MMRLRNRKTERHGFTLVELVAALAVAGFIMLITGTAVMSFWRTWEASSKEMNRLQEYRRIDAVMDTLVRNMIPFSWPDEEYNETDSDLLFDGQPDSLFFSTVRRSYGDGDGALLFVRLKLEEGKLVADYSTLPRFPWLEEDDPDMPYTREILMENVRSLSFLYADRNSSREVEWDDDAWDREEKPYLPLAIRMTIVREDGSEESWLRRTAGSGSSSVFGDREISGNE